MKKQLFIYLATITMISIALWFVACQKETSSTVIPTTTLEAADRSNGDSKVFPPTAHPYGKSYTEWTKLWMIKFMDLHCDENPWLNPAINKVFYESGPVYYMAGIPDVGGTANITVPHGKAILFPLVNFLNDWPCPDPSFQPGPNQTMEEFLTQGVVDLMALVSAQSVTVDGAAVSNPGNYLFTTNLFYFTGQSDLGTCFDPCITGASQPGVGSGDYIMLKPLSFGVHTVHYHIEIPAWGAVQDGTFNITVI